MIKNIDTTSSAPEVKAGLYPSDGRKYAEALHLDPSSQRRKHTTRKGAGIYKESRGEELLLEQLHCSQAEAAVL